MNFTAIDFETATADRASACSVGLVVVKEAKIVNRFSSLIRPPNLEFHPKNISIHGITPADVADEPTFQELWPQLSKYLCDNLLVAHSAAFDMSVLHRCLNAASIQCPPVKYVCTVSMSRQLLPGLKNHRLMTLAELFGIEMDHHKAAADAATCAQLAILLARLAEPNGIERFARDMAEMSQPTDRHTGYSGIEISFSIGGSGELDDESDEGDEERNAVASCKVAAFNGLHVVFTGTLGTMTREVAESLVCTNGGHAGGSVSGSTDYVVVGDAVFESYKRTGHTTGKLARAVALQTNGEKAKIISETEFLAMTR